jgi:hypothetical protein
VKEETMSGWTSCAHCGLKHSTREDGLCPRCRQPGDAAAVADEPAPSFAPTAQEALPAGGTVYGGTVFNGNVYAPPRAGLEPAAPVARPALKLKTQSQDEVPLGARLAGLVLILNGIGLLIERGMGEKTAGPPSAVFVDILVGGLLIAGVAKTLPWAKIRVGLGAIVLPILLISQGNAMMAGFQIAFSLSLLALLIGDASKLRIGAAMTVLGLYMTLEVVGLMSGPGPESAEDSQGALQRPAIVRLA